MTTIYDQLGRDAGISKAVGMFYERVQADPRLSRYFEGADMPELRRHQAALLVTVTGGPAQYGGRDLAVAHAHLGISEEDFLRVAGHLVSVLQALSVAEKSIEEVTHILMIHKDKIVGASSQDDAMGIPSTES